MHIRKILALILALALCAFALAEGDVNFSFSGGSGKVQITCAGVEERDGQTWATIVFSSPNYPTLTSEGVEYTSTHEGKTSIFVIPVTLGGAMTVSAVTTAMSKPHAIDYTICVGGDRAAEPGAEADGSQPAAPKVGWST